MADHPKTCKTCGTCPTCGHRPAPHGFYPYPWPYGAQPYWAYPPVVTSPIPRITYYPSPGYTGTTSVSPQATTINTQPYGSGLGAATAAMVRSNG